MRLGNVRAALPWAVAKDGNIASRNGSETVTPSPLRTARREIGCNIYPPLRSLHFLRCDALSHLEWLTVHDGDYHARESIVVLGDGGAYIVHRALVIIL